MADRESVGDYNAIIKAAAPWRREFPNEPESLLFEAKARLLNGDIKSAIAAWEAAKAADPSVKDEADKALEQARRVEARWGQGQPLELSDDDLTSPRAEWRARAQKLLADRNYPEIERVAAQLAQSKQMTADGKWLLIPFFKGLGDTAPGASQQAWEAQRAQLEAWHEAQPASDLARAALARSWVDGAWKARGGDWGSEAEADAWTTVKARAAHTAELLGQGAELKAHLQSSPLFFETLQSWALLASLDEARYAEALEATKSAYPTFWSADLAATYRLVPRWSGKYGAWESFAARQADAVGAAQGQDAGDALYARMVWMMMVTFHRDENIWEKTSANWPRTSRGMKLVLSQFPDSLSAQTALFELAYAAKDWKTARETAQTIGGQVDAQFYGESRARFARERLEVLSQD